VSDNPEAEVTEVDDVASLKAKIAELEPDAAVGRAHREAELRRIEAGKAKLSEDQRAIVDALPSVEMKAKALASFGRAAPRPPMPGGPPGSTPSYEEAWKDPAAWKALKARDPEGAARWVRGLTTRNGRR
jgi:hypothetical protein